MDKDARIYVAGHRGMVGSALVRRLQAGGYGGILTRTHAELDLLNQQAVFDFLSTARPDYIRVTYKDFLAGRTNGRGRGCSRVIEQMQTKCAFR
jgi:hypothetical protein